MLSEIIRTSSLSEETASSFIWDVERTEQLTLWWFDRTVFQMVTDYSQEDSESQMRLTREDEDDLCKIWDMAMDKDVAGFLQEFKAADILLGVIAKSQCPRLTVSEFHQMQTVGQNWNPN